MPLKSKKGNVDDTKSILCVSPHLVTSGLLTHTT
jgi:hypothetical protein